MSLGNVSMAATSLYVDDLDAAVNWYRDKLGLEPISEGKDAHRYATYSFGGALVVLEPTDALLDGTGARGSGAATVNVVVERDPNEIHAELTAAGIPCSRIVESGFLSFLVTDPWGNRFYITRPVRR